MALTILEGSTFCICDDRGDLGAMTGGLFALDTRFLSRLFLTVNGATPLLLSSGRGEYFSAAFFLRNPLAGDLPQDVLSIKRERFVGDGMQDKVVLRNETHGAGLARARARGRHGLRGHLRRSRSTTSRSATRSTRSRCLRSSSRVSTPRRTSSSSATPRAVPRRR